MSPGRPFFIERTMSRQLNQPDCIYNYICISASGIKIIIKEKNVFYIYTAFKPEKYLI